ncbi:glycerophosphodiester phosphodiesterase family protein [Agaribacterium haliotis]|uniref:glycerophosphodiester phosphodiesterase family protein n=1 Tax=Agaribacterium haliotis TaxID=2013869 RepID=UPI000BB593FB|nr:glycerophosphodiester phosphodiesterase family protein [Agaribacterium haliotis]
MKFVAHRGLAALYPENTLLALARALQRGADAVECDLQFSADKHAFLLHDVCLSRTSRSRSKLVELDSAQLKHISVHEPERFAEKYFPCRISRFTDALSLMRNYPGKLFFAEIKREVFHHFTYTEVFASLLNEAQSVLAEKWCERVVFISYDEQFLAEFKACCSKLRCGWVLSTYDNHSLNIASELQPDFLICNKNKINEPLFTGPWQWMLYDISGARELKLWQQRGLYWVESWDVDKLMRDWRSYEL